MSAEAATGAAISHRVLRNTISNSVGKFLWMCSGFLLTPFILHRLGAVEFGLWALANSVISYGMLLEFGIGGAVIKYVAEFRAHGRDEDARNLIATALGLYSALGTVAFICAVALAPLFPRLFNVPTNQHSTAVRVVLLMGIGLGAGIPCTITTAVLRGLQRYDIVNALTSTGTIVYSVGTFFLLSAGGRLLTLVGWIVVSSLLMQIPSVLVIHRIAPDLRLGFKGANKQWVRVLTSFSTWLVVIDIAGRIQTKMDVVIVGVFLPISSVTPYAIARRLSEIGQIATDQFMRVLLPVASELKAANDSERMRTLYLTGTRLALALFLPIGCVFIMVARPLLTFWIGAAYARYAYLVFIFVLATLIDTSQWPAGSILQGMARHKPIAIAAGIGAPINVLLSVILVRTMGLKGIALSGLLTTAGVSLGFIMPYAMKTMKVSFGQILNQVLFPPLLPVIPTVATIYVLQRAISPRTLIGLGIVAAAGLFVYGITYLFLGASDIERQTCRNFALNTLRLRKVI